MKNEEMRAIVDKRRENLHQVACLRLFEAVHPGAVADNVGNHPNGFFNSSFEYNKAIEKKNKLSEAPANRGATSTEAAVTGEDVQM